jgi:hypothetical protein
MRWLSDALIILGLGLLGGGLWWWWPPAALMVVGGLTLAIGLLAAARGR